MQHGGTPQIDAALREVVEGVEAETGDRFFQSLVRRLASALSVDYAFVSELTHGGIRFRTRALWGRGEPMQNVEVAVDGTPCEAVLRGEISHYPQNLCELFPRDVAFRDWGAVSYCGVPLIDSNGAVVGHFAILDGKPMPDGSLGISVMRIFAARARAELDRVHAEEALRASEERLARVLDSAMDAIVTFDAEHQIELFNDAANKVFRCNEGEEVRGSLDRFLGAGLRTLIETSCAAIRRGAGVRRYFLAAEGLTARRADGSEFPIEATLSHVRVNCRDLFTLILRDVDELHRAERELGHVSLHNGAGVGEPPAPVADSEAAGGTMKLAEFERHHIESALERAGGRIEGAHGAARLLGLNPSTLRSRMKKLGIQRTHNRP